MWKFLLLWALLTLSLAHAETIETRIHDIWDPEGDTPHFRILSLADGRVYQLPAENSRALSELRRYQISHEQVRLITSHTTILDIQPVVQTSEEHAETNAPETLSGDKETDRDFQIYGYGATDLTSESAATTLFTNLGNAGKFQPTAQCYQIAHVWAYYLWKTHATKSMKVFLFFTRRYINEYKYEWWFHVAPFVYVKGEPRVMDYIFTKKASHMKEWTDTFMKGKQHCQVISKYTEYSQHEQEAYCYLREVPMYFFQPLNVEYFDRTGISINSFAAWEVTSSHQTLLPGT